MCCLVFEASRDKRDLYLIPVLDKVLLGTTDTYHKPQNGPIPIDRDDVTYLLDSVNALFPSAHIKSKEIITIFAGIRPLIGSDKDKKESDIPRDFAIKVQQNGLVSITGGKLTTYRRMAKSIVDKVVKTFFSDRKHKPFNSISPISGGEKTGLGLMEKRNLALSYDLTNDTINHLID